MLLLRLGAILLAIAVAGGLLLFFVTGERKYLRFSWATFKWALIAALAFLALLALERLVEIA